jgi:hypothetical protein
VRPCSICPHQDSMDHLGGLEWDGKCAFPLHMEPQGQNLGRGGSVERKSHIDGRCAAHSHCISLQPGEPASVARLHPVSRHPHLVECPPVTSTLWAAEHDAAVMAAQTRPR